MSEGRDMEYAEWLSKLIRDVAEICYLLRQSIESFKDAVGPYAIPYIDALLESIVGVQRLQDI